MAVLCSIPDLRAPSCHRTVAAAATIRAPQLAESAASITRFWTPTAQLAATAIALAASAALLSRCVASQAAATRTNLQLVPPQLVPPQAVLLELRQEVPQLVKPLELVLLVAKMVEQEAPLVLQALHLLSQEMLPANQLLQVEMQKATRLL